MSMHLQFIRSAKQLIYPNGVSVVFTAVTNQDYNIETQTAGTTEVQTTVIAFPKVVKVSQWNYPNLVNKTVEEFLIVATDLTQAPKPLDKLTRGSDVFTVDSTREHVAGGSVVIYKVLAYKG